MASKRLRQAAAAGLAPKSLSSISALGKGALEAAMASLPVAELTAEDVPDEARRALLQIAEGVSHLHSQRIVHRCEYAFND